MNAAGKSNLRDAFLFLHGIGRGYTLAEILGEKFAGGERVWRGTRGGIREVAYLGSHSFELIVELRLPKEFGTAAPVVYQIGVSVTEPAGKAPRIVNESLYYPHHLGRRYMPKGKPDSESMVQKRLAQKSCPSRRSPKEGPSKKSL